MDKEKRKHLRDEISAMLNSIGEDNQTGFIVDDEVAEATKEDHPYDFEEMSSQFTKKAREITDSLFKNFVDLGIFEKNDYAKHKKELDTINISNLFFQLKTLKITIIKVMEEIASGNTHPRLLEVMGQLQDKMASITKTQANYILFLEDTYRTLNREVPINGDTTKLASSKEEGQFFVTIGTKNVIKSLPEAELEVFAAPGDLVNPSKKIDLMKDRNIKIEEDESDDFIDLTEII